MRPTPGLEEAKKIVIPNPLEQPTLTVPAAAALLGCSADSIYDAIQRNDFLVDALRVGRKILLPTAPLLARLGLSSTGPIT